MTKCFVDRLYYLMARKSIKPKRKAVALFTCGMKEGSIIYQHMQGRFDKILFRDLGYEDVKISIVPGMKTEDFGLQWQARLLFPKSCPAWFAELPGKPGEIFLDPTGKYVGEPPRE